MSIKGSLEDLSVVDLLQFIHLGGRSGTLMLVDGARQGRVTFHRGRIVGANGPATRRLGDLLVEDGVIDLPMLARALERQRGDAPRQSLGRILVELGALSPEELRRSVEAQVQATVLDLVTWRAGSFDFRMDELRLADDIGVDPGELLLQVDLNTQALLLEAMRIFDEQGRRDPPAAPPAQQPAAPSLAPVATAPSPALRLQVVSPVAADISRTLAGLLRPPRVQVAAVSPLDAGSPMPGEGPPVVLFDLRGEGADASAIARIRRTRPRTPVLAVAPPGEPTRAAFEAGALAVLPPDARMIAACYENVVRQQQEQGGEAAPEPTGRSLAKLRAILTDLRSGLLSATVSLSLMNIIADSVERAVLFMVRREQLLALGAFGAAASGRALAEATANLTLPLAQAGGLAPAVRHGRATSFAFDQVPEALAEILGRPTTGECAAFAVQGTEKVIALVYADNGRRPRAIEQVEILELAAAHAGVTFENELLRRRLRAAGS